MAPAASPTKYGRGRREIKKTARFEDLEIPGVNSAPNLVRPKQAQSPLLPQGNGSTSTLRHSTGGEQQTTDIMSKGKSDRRKKNDKKAAKNNVADDSAQVANSALQPVLPENKLADTMASTRKPPNTSSNVATASVPSWKKTRPKKSAAPRNPQPQTQYFAEQRAKTMSRRNASGLAKTKHTNPTPEATVDLSIPFTHEKLKIYDWPAPLPSDFTDLHQWQKDWKAKTDAREAEMDRDPELDDWHELSGRRESYSTIFTDFSMEYSIACSWIKHAKRAFRAGKSWKEFETEEREMDSQSKAKEIQDPVKRKEELSWALSDEFRLEIFDLLKMRLCHEIWLQEYVAVPVVERKKQDSLGDVFAPAAAAGPPLPEANAKTETSGADASRDVVMPDPDGRAEFPEMESSEEED